MLGTLLEEGSFAGDTIGHPGHQQQGAQHTSETRVVGLLEVYPTLPVHNDNIFLVATGGGNDSSFKHQDNFQP